MTDLVCRICSHPIEQTPHGLVHRFIHGDPFPVHTPTVEPHDGECSACGEAHPPDFPCDYPNL